MKNISEKPEHRIIDLNCLSISIITTINANLRNINTYDISFDYNLLEDDNESKIIVGGAVCYYLNSYDCLTNEGLSLLDLADSLNKDLGIAVYPVINEEGCLKEDYVGSDILYIERFYVKPEFRGKGIGKSLFPLMLSVLARNAGVITIIPAPSEEDGNKRIDKEDERYTPTLKHMVSFIKQFNFQKVNSEVWVKDTSLM